MGGGLESSCVGRVYSADGARHHHEEGARSNNPQNKTQFMVNSNVYMFRHRSAIFRESTKIKAQVQHFTCDSVCSQTLCRWHPGAETCCGW